MTAILGLATNLCLSNDPLLRTIARISDLLDDENYPQALERFGNMIATINDCDPYIIEKAYLLLFRLLEQTDSLLGIQVSISKLLEISADNR